MPEPIYQASLERWLSNTLSAQKFSQANKHDRVRRHALTADDAQARVDLGTNGKTEVKQFNHDSYTGVSTQDFLDRATILYTSIMSTASRHQADVSALESIQKRYETLINLVEARGSIDPRNPPSEKIVLEKIQACQDTLQLFVSESAKDVDMDHKSFVRAVKSAEGELTLAGGRSNLVNTYSHHADESNVRVNFAKTIGNKTIPSQIRTIATPTNFIYAGSGSRNEIDIAFTRHSSPLTLLKRETYDDEIKRREDSVHTLRGIVDEHANHLARANPDSDVIEVEVNSVGLLSMIRGDKKFQGDAGEVNQVKDIMIAVGMLNSRTYKTQIDSRDVTIKPIFNFMNIGVDSKAIKYEKATHLPLVGKTILKKDYETYLKNRGVYDFLSEPPALPDVEDASKELLDVNDLCEQLNRNMSDANIDIDFKDAKQAINSQYNKLYDQHDVVYQLHKQIDRIAEVDPKAHQLDAMRREYTKAKKEYSQLLNQVDRQEKTLNRNYQNALNNRKSAWGSRENRETREKIIEKTTAFLTNPENQNFLASDAGQSVCHALLAQQANIECEDLFHRDALITNEHAYEFTTRYLSSCYAQGKAIDFFCKSGKDRTGMQAIHLAAYHDYISEHKHPPRVDNPEDMQKYHTIAARVYECSVNHDIAGQNIVGARGVQTSNQIQVNSEMQTKPHKKLGKMAKGIYKEPDVKKAEKRARSLSAEEPTSNAGLEVPAQHRHDRYSTPRHPGDQQSDSDSSVETSSDEASTWVKANVSASQAQESGQTLATHRVAIQGYGPSPEDHSKIVEASPALTHSPSASEQVYADSFADLSPVEQASLLQQALAESDADYNSLQQVASENDISLSSHADSTQSASSKSHNTDQS